MCTSNRVRSSACYIPFHASAEMTSRSKRTFTQEQHDIEPKGLLFHSPLLGMIQLLVEIRGDLATGSRHRRPFLDDDKYRAFFHYACTVRIRVYISW